MLVPALLVAFAYWITWLIDGILGWADDDPPDRAGHSDRFALR